MEISRIRKLAELLQLILCHSLLYLESIPQLVFPSGILMKCVFQGFSLRIAGS